MTLRIRLLTALLCVSWAYSAFGLVVPPSQAQADYEREITSVVRNKRYFKKGRVEFHFGGGINPFDLTVSQPTFYGRATYNFGDQFGWEVINGFFSSPKPKGYITKLAKDRGLSNVQFPGIQQGFTTSLVWSPIYSKTRLFGARVLYFDLFAVVGGGMASTKKFRLSSAASGSDAVLTEGAAKWDPVVNLGIGFKVFLNRTFSLVVDLRNYVLLTETYGKTGPRSNYTTNVLLGVTL